MNIPYRIIVPPKSTGDRALDRLLTEGWIIDFEDDKRVYLKKMKGGEAKNIIHFKRQPAKKR